jgi:hypothetical protein
MSWSAIATSHAIYQINNRYIAYNLIATGNTTGTAKQFLKASRPFMTLDPASQLVSGAVRDSSFFGGWYLCNNTDGILAYRYDTANYGIGSNRGMAFTATLTIA